MDQQTSTDRQKQTIEWLNKLIMLAQWKDKKLPFYVARLVREPTEYEEFLTRVRASGEDKTQLADTSTENTPIAVARRKLLEAVAAVPALREIFGTDQNPFKDAPPDHLELLAEVSDVTAHPQKTVSSRSGTIEAVIVGMQPTGELDPAPLIEDWLNKFLTLLEMPVAEGEKSTAEMLYELAKSPHWYLVMASLRLDRDYARDEEQVVIDTLKQWNAIIAKQTLKKLLAVQLSQAPKNLIRLAWEHRELFAEARAKRPENAREKNPDDERKQVANAAFQLFHEKFKTQVDEIKADLQLLAIVGSHVVNVRKFAKLDGFVYTWPEIARLGMANYKALKRVEDLVLNRAPRPTDADLDAQEARELYSMIENNERLKRFMRIRPRFNQIDEKELMQYRPLAPVMVGRPGSEAHESANFVGQQQSATPASQAPTKVLQVQNLNVERVQGAPPSDQGLKYELAFLMPGFTSTGPITFRVEKLLERILASMGVSSDSGLQEILKELFASDPTFAEERIRRGGIELVSNVLLSTAETLKYIETPGSWRLVVNSPEREIHYLPWEWWPTSPTLMLSSPDQSVIRSFKSLNEDLPELMLAPLRLMSVIPDTPTGTRFTSDITLKALKEIASAPGVQYRPVIQHEATWANLQHELEDFGPHIVHFEGSWMVSYHQLTPDDESRYERTDIFLPDHQTTIKEFTTLLRNNGVQLLVIGRNAASRIYENPCATAAFDLAKEGLSVIAPMRAIDDAAATTFTTELYRAFLQGNKLESALHLARRNLASKGGDWTVFALFTDPDRLQYLELVRASA